MHRSYPILQFCDVSIPFLLPKHFMRLMTAWAGDLVWDAMEWKTSYDLLAAPAKNNRILVSH
jgi:hypothetical protein